MKNVFLQKTTILNATVTDLKEEKKTLHLPSVIEYLNGKVSVRESVRVSACERERERVRYKAASLCLLNGSIGVSRWCACVFER